jgi:hypothetical protein
MNCDNNFAQYGFAVQTVSALFATKFSNYVKFGNGVEALRVSPMNESCTRVQRQILDPLSKQHCSSQKFNLYHKLFGYRYRFQFF